MQMEFDKYTKAFGFIDRFRELTNYAETIVFPQEKNSIFLPVDMKTWSQARKILYKASLPYLYADKKQKGKTIYLLLSLFVLFMPFSMFILAARIARSLPIDADWFLFLLLLIYMFLSFYGILGFIRDSRYSVVVRIFCLFLLFIVSAITSVSLFPVSAIGTHVIKSLTDYIRVFFLILAIMSVTFSLLINTFVMVLLSYIQLLKFTKTIQTPKNNEVIKGLLNADVASEYTNNKVWRLLDLSKKELSYLRLWSESNLSSSEKRTVPALIIIACIGLLLSVDDIRNFLISSVRFNPVTSAQPWLSYIFLIAVVSFMVIFSETMVAIFKNIAVQSLVIEACLVAEYVVEEANEIQVRKKASSWKYLLKRIIQKIIK